MEGNRQGSLPHLINTDMKTYFQIYFSLSKKYKRFFKAEAQGGGLGLPPYLFASAPKGGVQDEKLTVTAM